jgi:hypothetical protein
LIIARNFDVTEGPLQTWICRKPCQGKLRRFLSERKSPPIEPLLLRPVVVIFQATMRALLVFLLLALSPAAALAASCPVPKTLSFQVVRALHRDQLGFTEGLEWYDGALWESTGDLFGESRINRIDPATGHVTLSRAPGFCLRPSFPASA